MPKRKNLPNITYEDLQQRFHLPLRTVAKEFAVCVTFLKKVCRQRGIERWPRRQIQKLHRATESVAHIRANLAVPNDKDALCFPMSDQSPTDSTYMQDSDDVEDSLSSAGHRPLYTSDVSNIRRTTNTARGGGQDTFVGPDRQHQNTTPILNYNMDSSRLSTHMDSSRLSTHQWLQTQAVLQAQMMLPAPSLEGSSGTLGSQRACHQTVTYNTGDGMMTTTASGSHTHSEPNLSCSTGSSTDSFEDIESRSVDDEYSDNDLWESSGGDIKCGDIGSGHIGSGDIVDDLEDKDNIMLAKYLSGCWTAAHPPLNLFETNLKAALGGCRYSVGLAH